MNTTDSTNKDGRETGLSVTAGSAGPPGSFHITEGTHPNGRPYLEITRGRDTMGICYKVDGGYLVMGAKRPDVNLDMAVKRMIDRKLTQMQEYKRRWKEHLTAHLAENGHMLLPPNKLLTSYVKFYYRFFEKY